VSGSPEPTRARYPDDEGYIERGGVRVFWERYGEGATAVMLLPGWAFIHSRAWKAQIPYLARRFPVVTFDPRGNGRSDRPREPEAYTEEEYARDALAVMDATGVDRAVLVCGARGTMRALLLAADHPDRVRGVFIIGPQPRGQRQMVEPMKKGPLPRYEGWDRFNPHYWRIDYRGFAEWFARQNFPEPHSTRQIESFVEQALETDPETLAAASMGRGIRKSELPEICAGVCCPALIVVGALDSITPVSLAKELAELLGARLVVVPGAGHALGRQAVRVNLLLREFVEQTW
jgi:pimeloyl-ACP methyl ester carboxylesterase